MVFCLLSHKKRTLTKHGGLYEYTFQCMTLNILRKLSFIVILILKDVALTVVLRK